MSAFSGLDPCVHCGFCLQSCPTYLATGDEADGPRGRIVLMQALAKSHAAEHDAALAFHLDRCLGCRACEPVCPSGVAYGTALEEARRLLADSRPIPILARLVNAVMGEPVLRTPILALARAVRPLVSHAAGRSRFAFAMAMLASTRDTTLRPAGAHDRRPPRASAGTTTATVFRGCIMDGLFSHVHEATVRTLEANDVVVADTPGQGCCGALHAHSGQRAAAMRLARANVTAFSQAPERTIVVNSAGCGAMLKEYGHLLANDPLADAASEMVERVRDVSETIAERGPRTGATLDLRVTYDPPCHLLHAQRIEHPPLSLLAAIPGLDRVTHAEAELCCGSAGNYSLTEPELSRGILERKVRAIRDVNPDVVASGNPGCVMQLGAGLAAAGKPIPVVHPVEILDWSYERAGYYDG